MGGWHKAGLHIAAFTAGPHEGTCPILEGGEEAPLASDLLTVLLRLAAQPATPRVPRLSSDRRRSYWEYRGMDGGAPTGGVQALPRERCRDAAYATKTMLRLSGLMNRVL